MFDTLFCNARIVDGTGTPWFWGSLGVQDGFVAAVLPRTTKPLSRHTIVLEGASSAPASSTGTAIPNVRCFPANPPTAKPCRAWPPKNSGWTACPPPLCDLSPYSGEVRARTGRAVAGRGHPQDDFANRPARSGWRTRASPCPDLTRISWPSTSGPCWTPTAATIPASIPPGCPMFWRTGRSSSETAS